MFLLIYRYGVILFINMKSLKILSKIDLVHSEQKKVELPSLKHIKTSHRDTNLQWLHLKSNNNNTQKQLNERFNTIKLIGNYDNDLNNLRTTLTVIGTKHIRDINREIIKQKLFESNKNIRRNFFREQPKLTFFFRERKLQNNQGSEKSENLKSLKQKQLLLTYSSRLKLLYNSSRNKNLVIVIPVDFILNQNYFWKDEEIYDCTRIWKKLENLGIIIWIIRKQKSLKKLKDYTKRFSLHLDMVYLLQSLKIQNPTQQKILTIDFNCITADLKLKDEKIMIISLVKNTLPLQNLIDGLEEKIPLIDYDMASFHIFHCTAINHKTFGKVISLFKDNSIQNKIDINQMWHQYIQKIKQMWKSRQLEQSQGKQLRRLVKNPQEIEDRVLQKIENLKNQWISLFSQMRSKIKNPSQTDSVKYMIGDLLKRNYNKFINLQIIRNINKRRARKILPKNEIPTESIQNLINKINNQYTIPTYLWQF